MIPVVYGRTALIDTSIAYAYFDPGDAQHAVARETVHSRSDLAWCVLNATSHETYTRVRYGIGWSAAMDSYALLRSSGLHVLAFDEADEAAALVSLKKYGDQRLSFHDALCAAVMLRHGIFRILSFDADFFTFGFELLPGTTRR